MAYLKAIPEWLAPEPEFPEPAPELKERISMWFYHHPEYDGMTVEALKEKINGDAPDYMLKHIDNVLAYQKEHAKWSEGLPIDQSWESGAIRFFGGDWISISCQGIHFTHDDGTGWGFNAAGTIETLISLGATEEQLRRYTGSLYEIYKAQNKLAKVAWDIRLEIESQLLESGKK